MLYTVRDVKAIVESIIGFPLYDLSLIYDGKKLNDSKINICLPVMKPVALKVKKSDTGGGAKSDKRGSTPIRIPYDKFSLIYSELLKREVKSLYTVRDVKAIVESIVGFPVNDQSLMCDGQQLDDSKVLSSYHIAAESILKMLVQNI
ncbi:polyubiquitin 9-like [Coffea arabica]|uniref:Polyubiquitin 9-like n=1 Tax=Coffea arabica TaxID=13443 RepID=A0ABM4W6C2_COFAR